MRSLTFVFVSALLLLSLYGCANNTWIMPTSEKLQVLPWNSYEEALTAYNKVKPGKTTISELNKLGFSLNKVSGAKDWNPNEVRYYFLGSNPAVTQSYLEPAAKECIAQKGRAREFDIKFSKTRGIGNWVKREFGYEKKDLTSGARLWVLFCYNPKTGIVLYKTDTPQPFIREMEKHKDPLGPVRKVWKIICVPCWFL